jgi:hypothetical protein
MKTIVLIALQECFKEMVKSIDAFTCYSIYRFDASMFEINPV